MGAYERMTVVVPDQMAAKIHAAVEAGEYASASEVVRDAMRLWSERREFREGELLALREAWDRGKASGVAGPLDMESIIMRAKGKKAAASGNG
ncbi:type II toxin-antitoxin system ParD family antitoxin [Novosphingobium sp. ERN07]|uniref:type II toxin-antitoxin system ParD family antitoxin n=1 Tax=Novosphingobium sp. ERN07 TaxID=2726187 RepID=UPI001456C7D3|nr:type II toxin-antitoxin system ParD family antitoxin [Novosphingobium sp. ERN07]NLR70325.1 type II toxin-antitoxin system ParD family antitoxin [Novosphingobium sp. ERN07]